MYDVMQMPLVVDWNEENETKHVAKHGIWFGIASAIFADPDRFEDQDTRKAYELPRFNTVGFVDGICIKPKGAQALCLVRHSPN